MKTGGREATIPVAYFIACALSIAPVFVVIHIKLLLRTKSSLKIRLMGYKERVLRNIIMIELPHVIIKLRANNRTAVGAVSLTKFQSTSIPLF